MVTLLMTIISVTGVHWHTDWTSQGCELCHLRQLPLLATPAPADPVSPAQNETAFLVEEIEYAPEPVSDGTPSRAPPSSSR